MSLPEDSTERRQDSGALAEASAAAYLQQAGLRLVMRNFRVRGGEIDLICREGEVLVFVEVRLRRRSDFGGAAASIGAAKRRRLLLAAQHYLQRHHRNEPPCRFDCILMQHPDGTDLTWLRNAFSADTA